MTPTPDSSNYKNLYIAGVVVAFLIAALTLVQTIGLDALGFHFGTVGATWLVLLMGLLSLAGRLLPALQSTPTAPRIAAEKTVKEAEKVLKASRRG